MLKKLSLSLILSTLPLSADIPSVENDCSNHCWGVDFGVEFLWWKPCGTQLDYAAETKSILAPNNDILSSNNQFKTISSGYSPGLRAEMTFRHCLPLADLKLEYTYFPNATDRASARTTSSNLVSPLLHPGFLVSGDDDLLSPFIKQASGKINFEYHRLNCLITGTLNDSTSIFSIGYGYGIAGIILKRGVESSLFLEQESDPYVTTRWKSHLKGIGLNTGIQLECCSSCIGNLFLRGNGLLLVTQHDATNTYTRNNGGTWSFHDPEFRSILPGVEASIGTDYGFELFRQLIHLRIGYQITQFFHTPTPRYFTGWDNSSNLVVISAPVNTGNYGFHGLFIGLNTGF